MGTVMHFKVLGTFEVRIGEQDLTPSAPKLRTVLSLLLINYNRITRADSLVDELWGDSPPISAATTLQTYIYQLRRMMTAAGQPPKVRQERWGPPLSSFPVSVGCIDAAYSRKASSHVREFRFVLSRRDKNQLWRLLKRQDRWSSV